MATGAPSTPVTLLGLFGVSCDAPGSVVLRGNLFANNRATDNGGALWISGTLDEMIGNRFTNNSSGGQGGAVYGGWWDGGQLRSDNIIRNVFTANHSVGGGGALWIPGDLGRVSRNTFRANRTEGSGGALAIIQLDGRGWRAVSGNRMLRNSASGNGGAFYLECSSLSRSARSRLVAANQLSGNRAYDDRRTSRIYQANVC